MKETIKFLFILLFFTSCIVQSPKYTSLEQVMTLQTGMSRVEVENTLKLQPFDIKAISDTSNVLIYIYRVYDRKTLSFNTTSLNGKKSRGKYVQLFVTYSMNDTVTSIESCSLCPDNLVTRSKIDFEKVFVFLTVTLPVLLIYIGVKY
jgi:hypothetical protein